MVGFGLNEERESWAQACIHSLLFLPDDGCDLASSLMLCFSGFPSPMVCNLELWTRIGLSLNCFARIFYYSNKKKPRTSCHLTGPRGPLPRSLQVSVSPWSYRQPQHLTSFYKGSGDFNSSHSCVTSTYLLCHLPTPDVRTFLKINTPLSEIEQASLSFSFCIANGK